MKEIIYICQGPIAALFTTVQRWQLTVASKYHAICWYGSSLAAVGALLSLPSDVRATREGIPRITPLEVCRPARLMVPAPYRSQSLRCR